MQMPIDNTPPKPGPDAGQLREGAVHDYRAGEAGYCRALLDAGRKAHQFLLARTARWLLDRQAPAGTAEDPEPVVIRSDRQRA